jgi:hypothetical protein
MASPCRTSARQIFQPVFCTPFDDRPDRAASFSALDSSLCARERIGDVLFFDFRRHDSSPLPRGRAVHFAEACYANHVAERLGFAGRFGCQRKGRHVAETQPAPMKHAKARDRATCAVVLPRALGRTWCVTKDATDPANSTLRKRYSKFVDVGVAAPPATKEPQHASRAVRPYRIFAHTMHDLSPIRHAPGALLSILTLCRPDMALSEQSYGKTVPCGLRGVLIAKIGAFLNRNRGVLWVCR